MSSSQVDLMCAAAVAIDRANTGYDQWQRWSFFNRATKHIIPNAEGDCSSVCGAIAVLGGFPVNLSDPFYTGTFRQRLVAAGFTAERYTGRHQVKRGRFLLNTNSHVEFCYSDSTLFSANKDERGGAHGSKAGDQTGSEVYFKSFFVPRGGWDWVLIPPASAYKGGATAPVISSGKPAKLDVDGVWGPATTDALQYINKTPRDRVVSSQPQVNRKYLGGVSGWEFTSDPQGSLLITKMQRAFKSDPDGFFGPNSIRDMQRYYGTKQDGFISAGGSSVVMAMQRAINKQLGY